MHFAFETMKLSKHKLLPAHASLDATPVSIVVDCQCLLSTTLFYLIMNLVAVLNSSSLTYHTV